MTQALATVQYKPTDLTTDKLGEVLVKSGFFQDTRDVAQAIVKVLAGRELGFGPIASMQGVYIVKGRVTLSANLVGAAIQRSGKYGYEVVELTNEKCTLHFYSRSDPRNKADGFTSTFTIQDAQQAGIASDTYKKFPRNMLFARALTNGARWYCPEVFNGPVYTPDELGAVVDVDGRMVDTSTGEVVEDRADFVPTREREVDDRDMVRNADESIWQNWLKVLAKAQGLGLKVEELTLPQDRLDLNAYGKQVLADIKAREAEGRAVGAGR